MATMGLSKDEIKTFKKLHPHLKKVVEQQEQMKQGQNTAVGPSDQEVPVKMWQELTLEEKVERMREQVKQYQINLQRQLGRMERQIHHIKRHTHNEKGQAVVEQNLTEYYGDGGDTMIGAMAEKPSGSMGRGEYF